MQCKHMNHSYRLLSLLLETRFQDGLDSVKSKTWQVKSCIISLSKMQFSNRGALQNSRAHLAVWRGMEEIKRYMI